MYLIGSLFLLSALVSVLLTAAFIIRYLHNRNEYFIFQSVVFVRTTFGTVLTASAALWFLFLSDDFHVEYVAAYSSRALPVYYKFSAFWAGQSGSLLLWSLLSSVLILFSVRYLSKRSFAGLPYYILITAAGQLFLLILNIWGANPFNILEQVYPDGSKVPFFPIDGKDMNPLLQHPAMIIHPPLLFVGYAGFIIPFAIAAASLLSKNHTNDWIQLARPWALFSWMFLTMGIMLGAWWAYMELGWGGYWAWDPVENASLLPWLTGTAFLHSIIAQHKKNYFRVWNVILISSTYLLCIFGTFITRSGFVSSVHAFAESPIGYYFLIYLFIVILFVVVLVLYNKKHLYIKQPIEFYISKESAFLFNNIVFGFLTLAVLYGTLFPAIYEAVSGQKITLGADYFNKITVPLAIMLLLLSGAGVRMPWGINLRKEIIIKFLYPAFFFVITGILTLLILSINVNIVLIYSLSAFLFTIIIQEFYDIFHSICRTKFEGIKFFFQAIQKHQHRLGSNIIHFGILLIIVGISGSYFNDHLMFQGRVGDNTAIHDYEIKIDRIIFDQNRQYESLLVYATLYHEDRLLDQLIPEYRLYKANQQYSSEVALYSTFSKDIYIVLAEYHPEDQSVIFQIYINPLVKWIWMGAFILLIGSVMSLWPLRLNI
jgi:cytochrome c-type biogenesis protein CcmF